jgi:hypothetical protein
LLGYNKGTIKTPMKKLTFPIMFQQQMEIENNTQSETETVAMNVIFALRKRSTSNQI